MKQMMKIALGIIVALISVLAQAQKRDDQRMEQDIEVAENILSTMLRQQFAKRNFFPMEVQGEYLEGYGVTFRLPQSNAMNIFLMKGGEPAMVYGNGFEGTYSYSYSTKTAQSAKVAEDKARQESGRTAVAPRKISGVAVTRGGAVVAHDDQMESRDSLMESLDKKLIEVATNFLADYGDVISQLKPEERIVITNKSDEWSGDFGFKIQTGMSSRRSMLSVEAKRDDITQMKQGKISRDQLISKLKIVNTQSDENIDPDLEVLASMFSRLYREDLSKTYYTQGDVTYERMKDFGVIYYMRVYSSTQMADDLFLMPTTNTNNATQAERDKKVKELYPKFENDLKENLVEYGRTLRSLKDDEQVLLNTKLTKCTGCGIPSTLELSIKNSVLKDYSAGKISREAAIAKVAVKKGGAQ